LRYHLKKDIKKWHRTQGLPTWLQLKPSPPTKVMN